MALSSLDSIVFNRCRKGGHIFFPPWQVNHLPSCDWHIDYLGLYPRSTGILDCPLPLTDFYLDLDLIIENTQYALAPSQLSKAHFRVQDQLYIGRYSLWAHQCAYSAGAGRPTLQTWQCEWQRSLSWPCPCSSSTYPFPLSPRDWCWGPLLWRELVVLTGFAQCVLKSFY